MNSTKSPLQWRVLMGGIAGLVGVGVIGAALAFPSVATPEALPTQPASATSTTSTTRTVATPSVSVSAITTAASPTASVSVSASPVVTVAAATPTPAAIPSTAVVGLPESAPIRVRIPAIGVDASTVSLGLDGNALETPADPDVVGWFTGAHTPGAPGRAVLAGHLTWNGRHTVFARLPDVTVGTVVEVDREDGTTARFGITKVATFEKDAFPTSEVYASTEEPSLVLITCGGEYNKSQHSYDSNIIAFATALD